MHFNSNSVWSQLSNMNICTSVVLFVYFPGYFSDVYSYRVAEMMSSAQDEERKYSETLHEKERRIKEFERRFEKSFFISTHIFQHAPTLQILLINIVRFCMAVVSLLQGMITDNNKHKFLQYPKILG